MRVARFVRANAQGMMWRPNDVLPEQNNLKAADRYLPAKKNSAADAASPILLLTRRRWRPRPIVMRSLVSTGDCRLRNQNALTIQWDTRNPNRGHDRKRCHNNDTFRKSWKEAKEKTVNENQSTAAPKDYYLGFNHELDRQSASNLVALAQQAV